MHKTLSARKVKLLGKEIIYHAKFLISGNTSWASFPENQTPSPLSFWPSRLELKNTPTVSLQRGKTFPTSALDMTLNNLMVSAPVILELWGMQSIRSLPSLPAPLWPKVVVPDRVLSLGQIELFNVLNAYFDIKTWVQTKDFC